MLRDIEAIVGPLIIGKSFQHKDSLDMKLRLIPGETLMGRGKGEAFHPGIGYASRLL